MTAIPSQDPRPLSKRQNDPEFIDMLDATSQLYTEAKRLQYGTTVVLTLVALVGSGYIIWSKTTEGWTMLVTLLALLGSYAVRDRALASQEEAARIQEQFDTELLGLAWNEILCEKLDASKIKQKAVKYQRRTGESRDRRVNWYANYDELTPELQALACQRENTRWDTDLRRLWTRSITWLMIVVLIGLLIMAYATNPHIQDLITGPALLLTPLFILGLDLLRDNRVTQAHLSQTNSHLGLAEDRAKRPNHDQVELAHSIRQIQDRIYLNRCSNPQIPDCFYRIHKRLTGRE